MIDKEKLIEILEKDDTVICEYLLSETSLSEFITIEIRIKFNGDYFTLVREEDNAS